MFVFAEQVDRTIKRVYEDKHIKTPDDLDIYNVAKKYNIKVKYHDITSFAFEYKSDKIIFIKEDLSLKYQRFYFYGGLAYLFQASGLLPEFFNPEEIAIHLAIPQYMIPSVPGIDSEFLADISEVFLFPFEKLNKMHINQAKISFA